MHHTETVVVVAGGGVGDGTRPDLPPDAFVVAADGGVDRALALGLDVGLAVGDFDSVTAAGLAEVERRGAEIARHPAAKDATDLELALDAALERGARRVVVVGWPDGRLDHVLAAVLLLGSPRFHELELDALLGEARVHVVRATRELRGAPGATVSLLPVGGPARGVGTEGLRYPLRGETLEPGTSRGVSNVFAEAVARVTVADGTLLAVVPAPEVAA